MTGSLFTRVKATKAGRSIRSSVPSAQCRFGVLLLLIHLFLDAFEPLLHRLQPVIKLGIAVVFVLDIHQRGDGDAAGENGEGEGAERQGETSPLHDFPFFHVDGADSIRFWKLPPSICWKTVAQPVFTDSLSAGALRENRRSAGWMAAGRPARSSFVIQEHPVQNFVTYVTKFC
jgi:hypothetical protein